MEGDDLFFEKLVDELFLDSFPLSPTNMLEEFDASVTGSSSSASSSSSSLIDDERRKREEAAAAVAAAGLSSSSSSASSYSSADFMSCDAAANSSSDFSLEGGGMTAYPAPAPLLLMFPSSGSASSSPSSVFVMDECQKGRGRKRMLENNCDEEEKIVTKKMAMATVDVDNSKAWKMFKGVSYQPVSGRYRARIKIGTKTTHLGYFATAIEAAVAYDRAAYELRGDKAVLNFAGQTTHSHSHDVLLTANQSTECLSPKSRCVAAAKTAVGSDALFQFQMS